MENTQTYFMSDIRYDLPTVREYSACMLPARRKWITALLVAYTAGYVAVYAFRNPQLLMWVCAVCLIALGILTLRNRDGDRLSLQYLLQAHCMHVSRSGALTAAAARCFHLFLPPAPRRTNRYGMTRRC